MNTFINYCNHATILMFINDIHRKIINGNGKFYRCENCKRFFISNKKSSRACSKFCKKELQNKKFLKQKIEIQNEQFKNKIKNYDYVECPLCGLKTKQLSSAHFKYRHNMSLEKFKKMYPDQLISAPRHINDTLKGQNNPMSKHNRPEILRKQSSPFSKEFYIHRNIPLEKYYELIKNVNKKKLINTRIDYYIDKGYSLKDAKLMLQERQRTFTLEKCKKRYGEERGYEIWKNRQEKWIAKVFNEYRCISHGVSSIATELINKILLNENCDYLLYGDNEKFLWDDEQKKSYKYDLTNIKSKRIIEFNGDFWHMNPNKYDPDYLNPVIKIKAKEKWNLDRIKINTANKHGYEIMVIWESDYLNDPNGIIEKCKEFIL